MAKKKPVSKRKPKIRTPEGAYCPVCHRWTALRPSAIPGYYIFAEHKDDMEGPCLWSRETYGKTILPFAPRNPDDYGYDT